MTKLKISLTILALLVVAAYGYQYLPAGQSTEDRHNTFTFQVAWSPPQSTVEIMTEIYVYPPQGSPETYVYRDRKSPRTTVKVIAPGSKILFSAHYPGGPKGSFWCQLDRDGDRVAYNNQHKDGLVTCDYKVPL